MKRIYYKGIMKCLIMSCTYIHVLLCLSYMCLKLFFKLPIRKSDLYLMKNGHPRTRDSTLLLREEKVEENCKFAILLHHEAQLLGRAF